jgi:ArsR family transcriptional regulator
VEGDPLAPLLTALRALAEPTRLRLYALLAGEELTVSDLVHVLGLSQPSVSRHLKQLTDAGLLERFQEGSWAFHRLALDGGQARLARRLARLLPAGEGVLARDRQRLSEVKRERAERAAAYFAKNASGWDKLRALHVDEAHVERALAELLPLDGTGALLDVGTGTGRMLKLFAPRAGRAVGVDLSPEMLAVARANLERWGLANCAVRRADLHRLPFGAESFDAVTIHMVLHYLDEPARAIAEVAPVLKPGGRLLVVDFAPHAVESLRAEHHHRRLGFADDEVAAWFQASGLTTKDVRHLPGDPLTVSIWLAQKAAGQHSRAAAELAAQATG